MPALLPSELPLLARTRQHWVVMFRRPHKLLSVAMGILLVTAVLQPNPMALVVGLVAVVWLFFRWQAWRAEWVLLTRRRIIRVRGLPETTTTEASLRLDRVSGAVLQQTVLGKMLNYGTIELEAPGQHPDLRRLPNLARPHQFYRQLRKVLFGDGSDLDLDLDAPATQAITAPLPFLPPDRPRRLR